jgi:hypothetical protein
MSTQPLALGSAAGFRPIALPRWTSGWITSPSILLFCFGPAAILSVLSWICEAGPEILLGHLALATGTFIALWTLSDRQLIDPIQAFVFLFHWWFAVGPATCATFYLLTEQTEQAEAYFTGNPAALWIVAIGLPVYGLVTLGMMRAWPETWHAGFLCPHGLLYSARTIGVLITTGLVCSAALAVGDRLGLHAFEEVNYLGATMTSSPLMAAIASVGRVSTFATLGLAGYVVRPGQEKRWLGWLILAISWVPAVFSGAKGAIMATVFYLVAARFIFRGRVPVLLLVGAMVLYLTAVEPFVDTARLQCETKGAYSSEQRTEIFEEVLLKGEFLPKTWGQVAIGSPFRGIYGLAQQTAGLAGLAQGPWEGESIRKGMLTWIPRALYPDKPDTNMGHFFATQLTAPGYQNEMQNVAITVPFEFVGNYGWLAGVLSFALIGTLWTILTVWLLSHARLATHPLMPWLLLVAMTFEQSVGTFINGIKDLPISLLVVLVIWLSSRHRL